MYRRVMEGELKFPESKSLDPDTRSFLRAVRLSPYAFTLIVDAFLVAASPQSTFSTIRATREATRVLLHDRLVSRLSQTLYT